MRFLRTGLLTILSLVFIVPAFAQSSPPQDAPQAEEDMTPGRNVRARRPVNCWKEAGIAPNLINQQWKIRDQGKTRIAAVCNESSTSAQQKHDQIMQIDSETERAISKLIPAKQLEAYKSCQAAEAKKHPKSPAEKELGPCGGDIPGASDSHSDHQ
jgi:hypothetical protein